MKCLLLSVAIFLNLLFSATVWAGNTDPLEKQPIPTTLSATEVVDAMIDAGDYRGWIVTEVEDGKLKADIHVRKHYVAVNILINEDQYDITYLDSDNMKYNPETGYIHRKYQGWVKNLSSDIQKELRKIARKK